MQKAILYKILQRHYRFRNPAHILRLPPDFIYSEQEYTSAKNYLLELRSRGVNYSFPEKEDYPTEFLRMKEPPLFFEYCGAPVWLARDCMSVIGARNIQPVTEAWLKNHLPDFLKESRLVLVSGGASGVDQLAHLIAIKNKIPTVFVLPSGLGNLYPPSLVKIKNEVGDDDACFLTEFEINQKLHKSHFYFRNRLIAALGKFTLVAQASLKSGSLLTVHHCLEMGKPVITVPAHPEMQGFEGNLKLVHDGAYSVRNFHDLHDFWRAESWSN